MSSVSCSARGRESIVPIFVAYGDQGLPLLPAAMGYRVWNLAVDDAIDVKVARQATRARLALRCRDFAAMAEGSRSRTYREASDAPYWV